MTGLECVVGLIILCWVAGIVGFFGGVWVDAYYIKHDERDHSTAITILVLLWFVPAFLLALRAAGEAVRRTTKKGVTSE